MKKPRPFAAAAPNSLRTQVGEGARAESNNAAALRWARRRTPSTQASPIPSATVTASTANRNALSAPRFAPSLATAVCRPSRAVNATSSHAPRNCTRRWEAGPDAGSVRPSMPPASGARTT